MLRSPTGQLMLAATVVSMWWAAACGPIEGQEKIPRPPYIAGENVVPDDYVIQREELGDGTVSLEVTELYDPNEPQGEDDELFGIWMRDRDVFDDVRSSPKGNQTKRIKGETFYVFDGMRAEIDPCPAIRANNLKETVWLLVSDRRFVDVTSATPAPDGFVVSRSWELSYSGTIIAECEQ